MKFKLAIALSLLLLLSAPVSAQSPCAECFKGAQEELKQCLADAISQEDKNSCAEKQQAQAKVCEDGECKMERDKRDSRNETLPQKK